MNRTDRDRSIETLLRSSRAHDGGAQMTDQCVDAESLAAWMEGGLSADARAAVEKHAVGCARCQALLASMARTAVDLESTPWWRTVTAKWLVPVAAVATALIVWVSVGRGPARSTAPEPTFVEASKSPDQPAVAAPVAPPPARPGASADKQSSQLAETADAEAPSKQKRDMSARRREDDRLASAQAPKASTQPLPVVGGVAGGVSAGAVDAVRPQGQTGADTAARSAPPPAASPVAAPVPAGPTAPGAPPQPIANAASAEAKPTAVGGVAEAVTIQREATANERAAGRGGANLVASTLEIRSPDPAYRWRILPPGGIQRSTDGGTTWAVVDPLPAAPRAGNPTPAVLTAGSSPSRDICWIVGRAGAVLLSTNGATWQRRPFPESVDLTGVRASSEINAIVMTADGRQFVTTDGGATWSLVK
jgi:hypothetical protein